MVIPTPPDATALVKVNAEGKLHFDTKAIAQENRELKERCLLSDLDWRSYLEVLGVIQTQAQPRDPLTEGLERVFVKAILILYASLWLSKYTLQLNQGKKLSQFPRCLQKPLVLVEWLPLRRAHLERMWKAQS